MMDVVQIVTQLGLPTALVLLFLWRAVPAIRDWGQSMIDAQKELASAFRDGTAQTGRLISESEQRLSVQLGAMKDWLTVQLQETRHSIATSVGEAQARAHVEGQEMAREAAGRSVR